MKSPRWWLVLAVSLFAAGVVALIVFFLMVWAPGAVLCVAVVLIGLALLVDVPKQPRSPR